MKPESRAHLHDVVGAALAIRGFVEGVSLAEYSVDDKLRSAVERKFEIMGEALNRLRRDDPTVLSGVRHWRNVISFRNILAHGYDLVDDRIVWATIHEDLEALVADVERLLH